MHYKLRSREAQTLRPRRKKGEIQGAHPAMKRQGPHGTKMTRAVESNSRTARTMGDAE